MACFTNTLQEMFFHAFALHSHAAFLSLPRAVVRHIYDTGQLAPSLVVYSYTKFLSAVSGSTRLTAPGLLQILEVEGPMLSLPVSRL